MASAWDETPVGPAAQAAPKMPSAWDSTPSTASAEKKPPPDALRRAGNTAAGFNYGAIPGTLGLPVDTALNAWDLLKAGIGYTTSKVTGRAPPSAFDPSNRRDYVGSSQWIAEQIRKLPQGTQFIDNQNPEDQASRNLYAGGAAVGGAMASNRFVPTGGNQQPLTTAQLLRQTATTAAGAGASGALGQQVFDSTGDPALAITASMTPAIVQQTAAASTRGAMRGGQQGRQRMQSNIDAAEQAGTTLTAGQASQSPISQMAEALLSKIPGGYGVFKAKGEQQQADLAATARSLTSGAKPEPDVSGRIIQKGIKSGDQAAPGFAERFKAKQDDLYRAVGVLMPADSKIAVPGTQQALNALTATVPGAPNIGQRFVNGKIASILRDFNLDTGLVRPDGTRQFGVTFGPQEAPQQPVTRTTRVTWGTPKWAPTPKADALAEPSTMAGQQEAARASFRGGEGAQRKEPYAPSGSVTRTIQVGKKPAYEPSGTVTRVVSEAGPVPGEGGWRPPAQPQLPYEAVKKLRTQVGDELSNPSLVSDVPSSQWKRLYAGLSNDLGMAASNTGPQAEQAWNRANAYTRAGVQRLEQLQPFMNASTPEKAFEMLVNSSSHGPTQINALKRSLAPDQWKQVVSNVINDLGVAKPGQQNAAGDAFSSETFLTNWQRMDPKAKTALVGGFEGAEKMRNTLDAMARTTGSMRASAKVLANPSGTAPALNAKEILIGGAAAGAYNPWALLAPPAIVGTAYGGSKLMTNPDFAKWLSKPTTVSQQQANSYAARLAAMLASQQAQEKGQ